MEINGLFVFKDFLQLSSIRCRWETIIHAEPELTIRLGVHYLKNKVLPLRRTLLELHKRRLQLALRLQSRLQTAQKLKKATRRRKEHGRVLHPVTGDQDQLGANAILKKFNYQIHYQLFLY